MKTLKTILIIILMTSPFVSFSQENASRKNRADSARSRQTYQNKTTRKTVTTETNTIRKENAPILNDNGSVNTTGAIDGSRSSTGRPDADTMTTYSVKKTKRTVTTGQPLKTDSAKKPKN